MRRDVHPAARGHLMRHRKALRGPTSAGEPGIGMFAGSVAPQALSRTIAHELVDSMTGDAGLRLAGSRGRRRWWGTSLTPQKFLGTQGGPTTPAVLSTLAVHNNRGPLTLNAFRGSPTTPAVNRPPTG
jgi:hypothetical protein